MGAQPAYPDEASPRGNVPLDADAGHVLGSEYAIEAGSAFTGYYGVEPGYLIPGKAKVLYGWSAASAPAAAYYHDQPDTKYADESMDPLETFGAVAGLENYIAEINAVGYDPYAKEPKIRAQPSTTDIVTTVASMPGAPIATSDDAVLALLMDF